jgi:hypothetical protein
MNTAAAVAGVVSAIVALLAYFRVDPAHRAVRATCGVLAIALLLGAGYLFGRRSIDHPDTPKRTVSAAATVAAQGEPTTLKLDNPPDSGTFSSPGTISGEVTNLKPRELIWTFNQPYDEHGKPVRVIYANPGPCPMDGEKWQCANVYVGDQKKDEGHTFDVWVAVVSEEQANAIVGEALVNTYHGGPTLAEAKVPHVTGIKPVKSKVTLDITS